jgi:hypothetical protein
MNRGIWIAVLGVTLLGVLLIFLPGGHRSPEGESSSPRNEELALAPDFEPAAAPKAQSGHPTPEPTTLPPAQDPIAPIPPPPPPSPAPTPFNPEEQPRKHHLLSFRDLDQLPAGYVLSGIRLTDQGFQLDPPKPGEEGVPRIGTLESPPFQLEFPSNAVSPLWKEDLPEGTTLFLEVAVSPDGENWSLWHPIEPDDDAGTIAEFYPDGRPNPNAGFTAGGLLFWGNRQWTFYRFRATLSSEVPQSPTFSGFHLFYQDSTLGQGHLAELQDDERQ